MTPVSLPRARAPVTVAISRAAQAFTAMGSRSTPLCRTAASLISEKRSALLWEDMPSVPRATLTPARIMAGIGATPEPSFRLDQGLWTQEIPRSVIMAQSSGVV